LPRNLTIAYFGIFKFPWPGQQDDSYLADCGAMGAASAIQLDIFAMPRFVIGNTLIVEKLLPVVHGTARA